MTAEDGLLRGRGLHAWYGSSHVLHGVDIDIGPGETLGLLGRNGMGKSTLIRTLLGHVAQREGSIRVAGADLSRARPHEVARRGVADVPEGRRVFANLSVRENLVMAARPPQRRSGGWGLERVLQTFPRLAERLQHLGGQLSGGEQQMVSIGRALMTNPALIWSVIAQMRSDGIATLIVDRNCRQVAEHADRLLVLQKGRVVLLARPAPADTGVPPPPARFNFAAHPIERNAARGAKAAFVDDHGSLSYAALSEQLRRVAAGLRALGLRREERVLLLMHDNNHWPLAFLGAIYAGLVPVAVNTLLTADDCAYMLEHSRAQAALVSGALLPVLNAAMAKSDHELCKVIVSHPAAPLQPSEQDFEAFVAAHEPLRQPAATGADDPGRGCRM